MSDPNDLTDELKRMVAYMQDQINKAEMLKHSMSPSSFILGVDPAVGSSLTATDFSAAEQRALANAQSQASASNRYSLVPRQWFLQQPPPVYSYNAGSRQTYGLGYGITHDDIHLPFTVPHAVKGLRQIAENLHFFPDPTVPNTLGWRSWFMDPLTGILRSPHMGTPWPDAECRCTDWPEGRDNVVRSHAGIHAYLVPHFWRDAPTDHFENCTVDNDWSSDIDEIEIPLIHGLIERYGKYVLGTDGWRAEWAVIRALHAPTAVVAMVLKHVYPDVEVTYTGQEEK